MRRELASCGTCNGGPRAVTWIEGALGIGNSADGCHALVTGAGLSRFGSGPPIIDMALDNSQIRHLSNDLFEEVLFHLHCFRAASTFAGHRAGRVFKMGDLGLGYYVDNQKPCAIELLRLSSTCKELRQTLLPVLLPGARAQLEMLSPKATLPLTGFNMSITEAVRHRQEAQRRYDAAGRFVQLCAHAHQSALINRTSS